MATKKRTSKKSRRKYGDKRDHKKIDLFYAGRYVGTTTWASNVREARLRFTEELKKSGPINDKLVDARRQS